jgi:hypothetical protein
MGSETDWADLSKNTLEMIRTFITRKDAYYLKSGEVLQDEQKTSLDNLKRTLRNEHSNTRNLTINNPKPNGQCLESTLLNLSEGKINEHNSLLDHASQNMEEDTNAFHVDYAGLFFVLNVGHQSAVLVADILPDEPRHKKWTLEVQGKAYLHAFHELLHPTASLPTAAIQGFAKAMGRPTVLCLSDLDSNYLEIQISQEQLLGSKKGVALIAGWRDELNPSKHGHFNAIYHVDQEQYDTALLYEHEPDTERALKYKLRIDLVYLLFNQIFVSNMNVDQMLAACGRDKEGNDVQPLPEVQFLGSLPSNFPTLVERGQTFKPTPTNTSEEVTKVTDDQRDSHDDAIQPSKNGPGLSRQHPATTNGQQLQSRLGDDPPATSSTQANTVPGPSQEEKALEDLPSPAATSPPRDPAPNQRLKPQESPHTTPSEETKEVQAPTASATDNTNGTPVRDTPALMPTMPANVQDIPPTRDASIASTTADEQPEGITLISQEEQLAAYMLLPTGHPMSQSTDKQAYITSINKSLKSLLNGHLVSTENVTYLATIKAKKGVEQAILTLTEQLSNMYEHEPITRGSARQSNPRDQWYLLVTMADTMAAAKYLEGALIGFERLVAKHNSTNKAPPPAGPYPPHNAANKGIKYRQTG